MNGFLENFWRVLILTPFCRCWVIGSFIALRLCKENTKTFDRWDNGTNAFSTKFYRGYNRRPDPGLMGRGGKRDDGWGRRGGPSAIRGPYRRPTSVTRFEFRPGQGAWRGRRWPSEMVQTWTVYIRRRTRGKSKSGRRVTDSNGKERTSPFWTRNRTLNPNFIRFRQKGRRNRDRVIRPPSTPSSRSESRRDKWPRHGPLLLSGRRRDPDVVFPSPTFYQSTTKNLDLYETVPNPVNNLDLRTRDKGKQSYPIPSCTLRCKH